MVAGKFVHEDDRVAAAGLFVIELDAVAGGRVGHRVLRGREGEAYPNSGGR
jgi:hypothetical protein